MKNISYLLEVGINEVSQKTHITNEMLEAIIEKDFAAIHPTKAIGFVNILQRDYAIDFTEWKEDFAAYQQEHSPKNNELFVYAKEPAKSKSFTFGFFVVIAFVIVAIGFIFYSNSTPNTNDNSLSLVSKPIEEAKENLENKNINFEPTQEVIAENNDTNVTSEEENQTVGMASDVIETTNSHENVENTEAPVEQQKIEEDDVKKKESVIIKPNGQIWIGLIDLKTHKKSQLLKSDEAEINSSMNYLILTGHGMFELNFKDINKTYNSQYPVRFILKDGNLTEIDKEKFDEINKGKNW